MINLPEDLRPELRKTGVTKTILVQAAPTVDDTEFLLELAVNTDFVAGVIGWFDLEKKDFLKTFDHYKNRFPLLLGVRPMLQDITDDQWILRPSIVDNLRLLSAGKIPFEFLTFSRHLPFVLEVLERVPELHAVIDHLSKPEIKAGVRQPWAEVMMQIGRRPNVFCKLSGMVTEADHKDWRTENLAPYVNHVLDYFGEDRVLFGSDWPVCLLAASYAEVINALRTVVASRLSPASMDKLFFQNGSRFYGI